MISDNRLALIQGEAKYPSGNTNPAFHPSERYPEYPFDDISEVENSLYNQVREVLYSLNFDRDNYGKKHWNPLGKLISPGDTVVLKPNFVRHHHRLGKPLEAVITNAAVLRPLMDYALIALQGRGKLIVADAPQGDTDFEALIDANGTKTLFEYYAKHQTPLFDIELRDIRKEWTPYKFGVPWKRIKLKGDPEGYTTVKLDEDSEFMGAQNKNYYGADVNRDRTKHFHNEQYNRYNIANTILKSDVFISVPKLKIHRKVGVTLNIKNLVGINGEKNFLPHFTVGSPKEGGDEFSNDTYNNKIDRKLKDFLLWKHPTIGKYLYVAWHGLDKLILRKLQPVQSFVKGDWWGNDTTWRAALDLMKILIYCDKQGQMNDVPQRKYLSIIDGIISGEKEGPLTPDPVYTGIIIGGLNPLLTDAFASTVMGIDWRKIKMINQAYKLTKYPLASSIPTSFQVVSNINHNFNEPLFNFVPPDGWVGHVELKD